MICIRHNTNARAGTLLVMLPGAGITAEDFSTNGMVEEIRAAGLAVDILAVQPELELYLEGSIAPVLHREIIEPALAEGYQRIWLLGISLGGMGALLYAEAHAGLVEGLILLAPFLGTKGTVAAMTKAGGLASWSAENATATEPERRMLTWLQKRPDAPRIYLGYGEDDRFSTGHRMLGDLLPKNCVARAEGGHDWPTWRTLLRQILKRAQLDDPAPAAYSGPEKGAE